MKGRGINSIRIRFTILVGLLSALASTALLVIDDIFAIAHQPLGFHILVVAVATTIPASVTYLMAGKLTGLIAALRRSTEAIAAGDFNAPVDVNCECDIGGLADSFRTMVARLNSNILRINILAYSDPVTRLPNRAVLNHVLNIAMAGGATPAFAGTVMFIDLDKFKQVNDTLGHDAGDELLRQASLRILSDGLGRSLETIDHCMTSFGELCDRPPSDILFVRFAGDEFVALLPGVTRQGDAEETARRIIACLEQPFRIAGTEVQVGASVGIATTPQDTRDPADLINFADLAMYAAKQRGRGRYAFFDATLRESALTRVNIERELRDAVGNREFILHYQPKMTTDGLTMACLEALVRWQHPVRGLVMPADFIAIAEQSGLIEELGDQVIQLTMEQAARWNAEGRPRRIAFNVSLIQFVREDFAERVIRSAADCGAPPQLVEIELTESIAMRDCAHTKRTLEKLRAAGFRIAIDDFGCGFSNLSQLAQLPFDTLKIDRSLISTIGQDGRGESVVRAIISLGHSLGHQVVAEGVETLKEFQFLQHEHCDMMQGYFFARPMPSGAIDEWSKMRSAEPLSDRIASIETRLRAG